MQGRRWGLSGPLSLTVRIPLCPVHEVPRPRAPASLPSGIQLAPRLQAGIWGGQPPGIWGLFRELLWSACPTCSEPLQGLFLAAPPPPTWAQDLAPGGPLCCPFVPGPTSRGFLPSFPGPRGFLASKQPFLLVLGGLSGGSKSSYVCSVVILGTDSPCVSALIIIAKDSSLLRPCSHFENENSKSDICRILPTAWRASYKDTQTGRPLLAGRQVPWACHKATLPGSVPPRNLISVPEATDANSNPPARSLSGPTVC